MTSNPNMPGLQREFPVPQIIEMRYSLEHNGWFWRVAVENPWATGLAFDQRVYGSGFAGSRRRADREANRAIKSMTKRLARAQREINQAQSDENVT